MAIKKEEVQVVEPVDAVEEQAVVEPAVVAFYSKYKKLMVGNVRFVQGMYLTSDQQEIDMIRKSMSYSAGVITELRREELKGQV